MKILQIVLNDFTTDARVLRAARLGADLGARVEVYCLHEGDLPEVEFVDGIRVRRFRLATRSWSRARPVQLLKYLEVFYRILGEAKADSPDLIHANDLPALPIGAALARLTGARLVYDAHELWCDRESAMMSHYVPGLFALSVGLEALLARGSDAVLTVSGGLSRRMAETLKIPAPLLIRNLPDRFEPAWVRPGRLREALGIEADVPVVLYQGHVREGRGIETAIEAIPRLLDSRAVLAILGGGEHVRKLEQLAGQSPARERIRFLPEVPPGELLAWTADATVGLCPTEAVNFSYRHSLPNKFFEYLQVGLPVVCSDLPETTALIEEYEVGETFPAGDAAGLARALDRVLADPEYRENLARHAARAADELNWEEERRRLAAVYRALAPAAHAPAPVARSEFVDV